MTLSALPKKQRKYVRNRARGMSKAAAARKAGYKPSVARVAGSQVETPDVKAVFASLVQAKAPPSRVAQVIADGLSAEKTEFFSKDGVVISERNTVAWGERREYAKLAAEYGGYVAKEEQRHLHLHALGSLTPVEDATTPAPAPAPIDVQPATPTPTQ